MSGNRLLNCFYAIKPLIPRKVQIHLRRTRAKRILEEIGNTRIKSSFTEDYVFKWPEDYRSAAVITHDVETADGQNSIAELRNIEQEHAITSCWNFVTDRYTVNRSLILELNAAGHEVGVHGVFHDGRLFSSEVTFHERLPVIIDAARKWGAKGFRSPSLLYDEKLLKTIPFSWDSSIPAWDPFQPQPGGCGSYYPFKLSDICVELPVTLWQDFTLFEELQQTDIRIWKEQIDAIYEMGGLINVIIHPDYMNEQRLSMYHELLVYLKSKRSIWFALPFEIARWIQQS